MHSHCKDFSCGLGNPVFNIWKQEVCGNMAQGTAWCLESSTENSVIMFTNLEENNLWIWLDSFCQAQMSQKYLKPLFWYMCWTLLPIQKSPRHWNVGVLLSMASGTEGTVHTRCAAEFRITPTSAQRLRSDQFKTRLVCCCGAAPMSSPGGCSLSPVLLWGCCAVCFAENWKLK